MLALRAAARCSIRRGELGGGLRRMATICARFARFDMRIIVRDGDTETDGGEIEIADGVWRTTFTGDFQATPTGYTGTLTGFAQTHDGRRVFEATGVERLRRHRPRHRRGPRQRPLPRLHALRATTASSARRRDDYLIGFGGDDTAQRRRRRRRAVRRQRPRQGRGRRRRRLPRRRRRRRPHARRLRRRHLPRRRPPATG